MKASSILITLSMAAFGFFIGISFPVEITPKVMDSNGAGANNGFGGIFWAPFRNTTIQSNGTSEDASTGKYLWCSRRDILRKPMPMQLFTRDREDEYKGSHSNHEYVEGSGHRSYGRERDSYGDDQAYSSWPIERKPSNQLIASPPSYEDVTKDAQDNVLNERNGGTVHVPVAAPKVSSPSAPAPAISVPLEQVNGVHDNNVKDIPAPPPAHAESNGFDEFDTHGSVPGFETNSFMGMPPTSTGFNESSSEETTGSMDRTKAVPVRVGGTEKDDEKEGERNQWHAGNAEDEVW
ncbi:hypothetical protein ABZP36_007821 [Zizania latifolia]